MSNEYIDKYVSIDRAAEIVGVCRRTIYNWIQKDLLEYRRIASGRVRIKESSLWRVDNGKNDRSNQELS